MDRERIAEIRKAANLVGIISSYTPLRQHGSIWQGKCMECEGLNLSVVPDKGIYYCFDCHRGGSVLNFIMQREGMELEEAANFIAQWGNGTIYIGNEQ